MADRIDIRDVAALDRFRGKFLAATGSANTYVNELSSAANSALEVVSAEIARRERAVRECEENCGGLQQKLDEAVQARSRLQSAINRCESEIRPLQRGAQGRNLEAASFMVETSEAVKRITGPPGSGDAFGASGIGASGSGSSGGGSRTGSAGLQGDLKDLYDSCSFPNIDGRGRFFLLPNDRIRESAAAMPPVPEGVFTVTLHGSPESTGIGDRSLSPTELASMIRADPSYAEGTMVLLISCSTGKATDGFAHGLARELKVPVRAPTDLVWWPPDAKVGIIVSRKSRSPFRSRATPALRRDGTGFGHWSVFLPS